MPGRKRKRRCLSPAKLRVLDDVRENEGETASTIFSRSGHANRYIAYWWKHLEWLAANGYVEYKKRGYVKLTEKGRRALRECWDE